MFKIWGKKKRMAGGTLAFDLIQKIPVLSNAGTCLQPHPQWSCDPRNHSYTLSIFQIILSFNG